MSWRCRWMRRGRFRRSGSGCEQPEVIQAAVGKLSSLPAGCEQREQIVVNTLRRASFFPLAELSRWASRLDHGPAYSILGGVVRLAGHDPDISWRCSPVWRLFWVDNSPGGGTITGNRTVAGDFAGGILGNCRLTYLASMIGFDCGE